MRRRGRLKIAFLGFDLVSIIGLELVRKNFNKKNKKKF